MSFTQRESCGKCVPCREGTQRMLEILERIVAGQGTMEDLDTLRDLADMIENTALWRPGQEQPPKPSSAPSTPSGTSMWPTFGTAAVPPASAPSFGCTASTPPSARLLQVRPELPGVGHSRYAEVAVHH